MCRRSITVYWAGKTKSKENMAVGSFIPTAMSFPIWGLKKERTNSQEEGGWTYLINCFFGMPKFHKFDYRLEVGTRLFPKWVMFSYIDTSKIKK
jgi:hypothetical protein